MSQKRSLAVPSLRIREFLEKRLPRIRSTTPGTYPHAPSDLPYAPAHLDGDKLSSDASTARSRPEMVKPAHTLGRASRLRRDLAE